MLIDTPMRLRSLWAEMVEGWNFLRHQVELFSNTIISTIAQLAVGAEIVATIPYTQEVLDTRPGLPPETTYALLLSAIALGSVLGGIGVGWLGDRVRKGLMTIVGFIGMGLSLVVAGFVDRAAGGHRSSSSSPACSTWSSSSPPSPCSSSARRSG